MTYTLLLFAAIGVEPKAVIDAPAVAVAGDLVVMDGSKSVGSRLRWSLVNYSRKLLITDNGKQCGFAARKPGYYVFVLTAEDNGNRPSVAIHTLQLTETGPDPGPGPGPDPDEPDPPPPPPPPDQNTLSGRVESWVYNLQIPVADRQKDALALSTVFSGIGSAIAAGAIKDSETLASEVSSQTTKLLGTRAKPWEPWFDKLVDELDRLSDAGQLKDMKAYQSAVEAISTGLRRAGGVQSQRRRKAA